MLGFITGHIWPPVGAIALCLSVSGLDELLQWWLPERFGAWPDVGINAGAGLLGLLVAFSGMPRQ